MLVKSTFFVPNNVGLVYFFRITNNVGLAYLFWCLKSRLITKAQLIFSFENFYKNNAIRFEEKIIIIN